MLPQLTGSDRSQDMRQLGALVGPGGQHGHNRTGTGPPALPGTTPANNTNDAETKGNGGPGVLPQLTGTNPEKDVRQLGALVGLGSQQVRNRTGTGPPAPKAHPPR